ncbi:MAG: trypsin-like serine protease [Methylotenera sp.]|nr:trypsin-like serine protease [Oligoflexia bacterium]
MKNLMKKSLPGALICLTASMGTVAYAQLIGQDDRNEVKDMSYPYSAIGRLTTGTSQGEGYCTATLISENLIITAAHCVKGGYSYTFRPGFSRGRSKFKSSSAKVVLISGNYSKPGDTADYALLVLKKPLGQEAGWFKFADFPRESMNQPVYSRAGYGADGTSYSTLKEQTGCRMNLIGSGAAAFLVHECDLDHGDSGSAFFTYDPAKDPQATLFAIADLSRASACDVYGVDQYEPSIGQSSPCYNRAVPVQVFHSDLDTVLPPQSGH